MFSRGCHRRASLATAHGNISKRYHEQSTAGFQQKKVQAPSTRPHGKCYASKSDPSSKSARSLLPGPLGLIA